MSDTKRPCARCGGTGDEPDDTKTGEIFRAKRQAQKLRLKDVAERMHIAVGYLCELETGKKHWNLDMIQRATSALMKR